MELVSYYVNKAEQTRGAQNGGPVLIHGRGPRKRRWTGRTGVRRGGRGSEEHDMSQLKDDGNTSRWIVERRHWERQR